MSTRSKAVEPMDASVRENATAQPVTNTERVCYAAQTLVAEVVSLFPETEQAVEYGTVNGRNTALSVQFDLTAVAAPDDDLLAALLELTSTDARVWAVVVEDGSALVTFRPVATLQDNRNPFGLDDALSVLIEGVSQ